MASHPLFSDQMGPLVDDFIDEGRALLTLLQPALSHIRHADDLPDATLLALQSFRGSAGLLNLDPLTKLIEALEYTLLRCQALSVPFGPADREKLLANLSGLQQALDQLAKGLLPSNPSPQLLTELATIGKSEPGVPPPSPAAGEHRSLHDPQLQTLLDTFVQESRASLEKIRVAMESMDEDERPVEALESLHIAAQSIEDTANILSLDMVGTLAGQMASAAKKLEANSSLWEPDFLPAFGETYDALYALLDQVGERRMPAFDPRQHPNQLTDLLASLPQNEELNKPEDHPILSPEMADVVQSFNAEMSDIIERLEPKLVQLEHLDYHPALIDDIFRSIHTIKGSAGFLNLDQLDLLTHHIEEVLNGLRRQQIAMDSTMLDLLLQGFDATKVLLAQVANRSLQPLDLNTLIARLQAASKGEQVSGTPQNIEEKSTSIQQNPLVGITSESVDTVRIDVSRLDHLINLVSELVLSRNRLAQVIDDAGMELGPYVEVHRNLLEASNQINTITTALQSGVMRTRMVQIGQIFSRFPRLVRDVSQELGKKIQLIIEGADAEMDKSLTEEIVDPLVHLVRNAADHGIEMPEVRRAAGKEEIGIIRLQARHEGPNMVIVIEDDGAGINVAAVKAKAIESGIIEPQEAEAMPDQEAYDLVFQPGFTTNEDVTRLSGRGVGMDVVKTNIKRLNGTITIESTQDEGTRILVRLPLTLAISQSLIIEQQNEWYAIPLHAIQEIIPLPSSQLQHVKGRLALPYEDRLIPLRNVDDIVDLPPREEGSGNYVVMVGLANRRVGLVVDRLVRQQEIVIKPLGDYLDAIPGIAGTATLGDGRVIMILDVRTIIEDSVRSFPAP